MRISIIAFLIIVLCFKINAQNPDSLKNDRYFEVGGGLLTLGDIVWARSNFERYKPTYNGFFQSSKESNSKALPLLFTYKKQIKQGDWSWYTTLLLEFAKKRKNTEFHYYTDYRGIYSNIWGLEYKFISKRNYSVSFKFALGFAIVHDEERSNNPYLGTVYYPTKGNNTYIVPIPSGEIQPLSFRFGNKNAAYLNLSLGSTGFLQFGYSRKW